MCARVCVCVQVCFLLRSTINHIVWLLQNSALRWRRLGLRGSCRAAAMATRSFAVAQYRPPTRFPSALCTENAYLNGLQQSRAMFLYSFVPPCSCIVHRMHWPDWSKQRLLTRFRPVRSSMPEPTVSVDDRTNVIVLAADVCRTFSPLCCSKTLRENVLCQIKGAAELDIIPIFNSTPTPVWAVERSLCTNSSQTGANRRSETMKM